MRFFNVERIFFLEEQFKSLEATLQKMTTEFEEMAKQLKEKDDLEQKEFEEKKKDLSNPNPV